MDAQSYVEWCRLAGLYLENESHSARYRAYGEKLSAYGLTTAIVGEFLEDNSAILNLQEWRNFRIYEMSEHAQRRIELTAGALEAIGARRAAAKVRTLKSTSPLDMIANLGSPDAMMSAMKDFKLGDLMQSFREHVRHAFPDVTQGLSEASPPAPPDPEIESREQIEHLVQQYVTLHESELQADIDKFGDPRLTPGFTPQARMRELEQQYQRQRAQEKQQEDIQKLQSLMDKIEKRPSKSKPPKRLSPIRREFLEYYRRNRDLPKTEQTRAMRKMIESATQFIEDHKALFHPDPVSDPQLLQQLAAWGEYDVDLDQNNTSLRWDAPQRFKCPWTRFSLSMNFPQDDQESLRRLLAAADRLAQRFPKVTGEWREQLIDSFRNHSGMMDEEELDDYERNDDGDPTEESILLHAGEGSIHLVSDAENDYLSTRTYFSVDWDEEHGFEIAWEDETSEPEGPAGQKSADFSCGQVRISGSGPPLTCERIADFETRYSVRIPTEYCQFLLLHNGGVPSPNHLALRIQGTLVPVDVERFYSLLDDDTDRNLQTMTERLRNQSLPPELLSIADLHAPNSGLGPAEAMLLLVLSGKSAGQLFVFHSATMAMAQPFLSAPAQAMGKPLDILLSMSMKAAKSLSDLFEKLTARPEVKSPQWLQHIREGRTQELLHWLREGGKLTDSYKDYGQPIAMSVIDYLARDASPEMLRELVADNRIQPKQILASWQRYQMADVGRFAELMAVLPKQMWGQVLASPSVWDHPTILEQLGEAGVDMNAPVNDEGMPPLHLAVQCGRKDAVRWLIAQGADVHKEDKYQRTAFIWAEHGPGFECLPLLQGKDENPAPPREPGPDAPGIAALWQAAEMLPQGQDLLVSIQIKSPPVTRVEQAYYRESVHYRLSIFVRGDKVVFNDMNSARQEYLFAESWPSFLFAPILQWPDLRPLWPTLDVREFEWTKATKKRNYEGSPRPDLHGHARSALEQAFNAEEAAARRIRLRK